MEKAGVGWPHDKSSDDDIKPVKIVTVQLHVIESCRSVLEVTLKNLCRLVAQLIW